MRQLPIRIRLTLLYFAFFAAAGLLLSATSWLVLRQSLKSTAQHELDERADDVQSFLNAESPGLSTREMRDDLVREYRDKDEGKYLQVMNDQGDVLYFSERKSQARPLDPFPKTEQRFHDRPGGLEVLARSVPVHGKAYRISTAMAMKKSNALLWSFFNRLLLLTPGLLLLAALAGHAISRKALVPVAEITAAVREINDHNLSRRLPLTDTHDELSDLSSTLNQMLSRIDSAFSSVRAFTANASHELRTPIALIRTRVEIALCFPRTAMQYQHALSEVQSSAEQMTGMLESLLCLARADAGVEQLRFEPIDLDALLGEVGAEWLDTAQRMNLHFSVHSSGAATWVAGDATALRRLFRILIDNAFRYTPAHGCVGIELASSQGVATVCVSDTGTGIAAKDLPHIFERFYRADQLDCRTAIGAGRAGAGLGLSLARWITEQHRAQLTVRSTVNCGSTFQFALPLTDGRPAASATLSLEVLPITN